jgi:hypothetical protein
VELTRRLGAGERLCLECWCAPRRCHAEVIADCLRWMVRERIGLQIAHIRLT